MKQKNIAFIIFFCISILRVAAEDKPVIQVNDFSTLGISSEETRLIQALFTSYLSDMGQLIPKIGAQTGAQPDSSPDQPLSSDTDNQLKENTGVRAADFSINGTIRLEQDGHVFRLDITNVKTGEVYSVSSIYKTTGELALKARSILETAFAESKETEKPAPSNPEPISESQIIGAWRGEAGIEMVNLQRGGRGVAFFSSGAQMVLSYTIANNSLEVKQISPNSERFYYPLPLFAAIRLAEGAEPMVWNLSLYQNGTVLSGVRQSTAVRMELDKVGELVNGGDVRQIQWTKATH
ncbi:MAG: hypothetical protein FWF29_08865 [Treponema sp.]|nr:hypothetical protein [Treponema sp.]